MNSLDKLLTNTTNRFQGQQSIILPQFQSNFTPISNPQHDIHYQKTKNQSLIQQLVNIQVPESYEQLLKRQKELLKILQEAKEQKLMMSGLFDKIFLVEQGKEEQLKKRFRRKKDEIQGKYSCRFCNKNYSSSTSLARHSKLKHPYSMTQPPQRDYQIPPQPNSINNQRKGEKEEKNERQSLKRQKQFDDSYQGDLESLEESVESQQELMFSQQLS